MSGNVAANKDGVKLTLLLKWSEAPQKYKKTLQTVLQTWANKQSCECKDVKVLKDGIDGVAEVVFTPASAFTPQKLFDMTLTCKDNTTLTIMAGPPPPEVGTQSPDDAFKKVDPARESTEMTQNTSLNDGKSVRHRSVDGGRTEISSVATLQDEQNHHQQPTRTSSLEAAEVRSLTVPRNGSFSPSGPGYERNLPLESSRSSSGDATAAVKTDASSVPADGPTPSTAESGPDHHEQMVGQRRSSCSEAGSTPPDRKCPFTIPVGHFWYLNQIYKKEIVQIQSENGVTMNADVRVTFEGNQEGEEKAVSEFTALVQRCSAEAASSHFHRKDVKQEAWDDIQKVLEKSKKLLFTVSSEEILVWGPRRDLDLIEKSWKVAQKTVNAHDSPEKSVDKPQNTPPNIIMHINDPLLSDGLTMEQCQWKLMSTSHKERVSEIEKKYGVDFETSEIHQGKVKVKPRYRGPRGNTSMESHASRALLKLYQRICTSVLNSTQLLGDDNSLRSRSSADGSEQGEE